VSEGDRKWLTERQTEGTLFSLEVKRWLERRRTKYQLLELAETRDHGRALALDEKFMLTERDEFFYHEMLVHPALLSHREPKKVLIVGGGDGGALREVLKHPSVEEAFLVEIDEEVIEASRRHLPSVHFGAFDDPRARVVVAPGEEFVKGRRGEFDAVIVDSPDPVGPGRRLFEPEFYAFCRLALRPGGVMALQAGTPFYWPDLLTKILGALKNLFPIVRVYLGFVPTYPSGMWAYVLTGLRDFYVEEERIPQRFEERKIETRYYTPEVHKAAFALPRFIAELVERALARD